MRRFVIFLSIFLISNPVVGQIVKRAYYAQDILPYCDPDTGFIVEDNRLRLNQPQQPGEAYVKYRSEEGTKIFGFHSFMELDFNPSTINYIKIMLPPQIWLEVSRNNDYLKVFDYEANSEIAKTVDNVGYMNYDNFLDIHYRFDSDSGEVIVATQAKSETLKFALRNSNPIDSIDWQSIYSSSRHDKTYYDSIFVYTDFYQGLPQITSQSFHPDSISISLSEVPEDGWKIRSVTGFESGSLKRRHTAFLFKPCQVTPLICLSIFFFLNWIVL